MVVIARDVSITWNQKKAVVRAIKKKHSVSVKNVRNIIVNGVASGSSMHLFTDSNIDQVNKVGGQHGVVQQQEEVLVVCEPHAVVDPRTMVVHLQDAGLADAAVMAPVRLVLPAPLAVPPLARLLHLLQGHWRPIRREVLIRSKRIPLRIVFGNLPGVREDAPDVTDHQHGRQEQENDELNYSTGSCTLVDLAGWSSQLQ
eukprot:CAMPEP_0177359832 /NCGR_PEP_ID=MMETSP0368-20130122/36327_1 /TAXON_ID=447022 ORGANISM="Scrippsiella hangoei-like, Strain SHHI-4" /NCGR_SAMPLE_ID=MMETSP0368 /ASSEMBLY_ACC=CAM_ASM_000363 /LENGTH=199 /DNA_ID=CAMNT_0018822373 /DNA_START=435 /DNA_END=1033 /DNA_ORIENTATION=+